MSSRQVKPKTLKERTRKAAWDEKRWEEYRKYHKEYREKHRDRISVSLRNASRRRKYNLSESEIEDILNRQGYKCGICERSLPSKEERKAPGFRLGNREHVDHCHTTGEVRGLLCGKCNRALGRLGDDLESVLRALDYIRGIHAL